MKITIDIPEDSIETVVLTLKSIIAQIKPEEHICLGVNGLYWTSNVKIAVCVDIIDGLFICEIDDIQYPFFQCGEPAQLPKYQTYKHKIVEKIKH